MFSCVIVIYSFSLLYSIQLCECTMLYLSYYPLKDFWVMLFWVEKEMELLQKC